MPHEIKPLRFKSLDGLSERQVSEHHGVLYAGYVKKLNEIEEKLPAADRANPNTTLSELRALKRGEAFATGGVYLHEAYFANLGGQGGEPTGAVRTLIERDFGSVANWLSDFKACGIVARGWVVLAYNWNDGKLHHYVCDNHMEGVWDASALLVLDVYEHAYFLDYATARKAYIEKFLANVDWDAVNAKIEKAGVLRAKA